MEYQIEIIGNPPEDLEIFQIRTIVVFIIIPLFVIGFVLF